MRLGQLRLPRAEGDSEDGVLTVIEAGGSVDDNLSRWRGQFTGSPAAETDTFEKGRLTVTTIRVEGAFQGMGGPMAGGGGPAKENYRLSGAVVRDPQRQSLTFLKATGPRATLLRWEDALESLFRSIEAE
jgi:hypothetical protein